MSKIVITGGLGRIGTLLVPHLAGKGYELTLVTRRLSEERRRIFAALPNLDIVLADAFNEREMQPMLRGGRWVIHLACTSFPSTSEEAPLMDIQNNIEGTLKLFQLSQQMGVEGFILPSSGGTVYGQVRQYPTSEDTVPNPISYHGAMKLSTENYLRVASRRGPTHLTILRISNPYGFCHSIPIQGIIDCFVDKLEQGEPVMVWGDGTQIRDFIFRDDLVDAIEKSIRRGYEGILNVGTSQGHSILEVVEELSRHYENLSQRIKWLPQRGFDIKKSVLDISRAREVLGWEPQVPLSEGIRRVIEEKRSANR